MLAWCPTTVQWVVLTLCAVTVCSLVAYIAYAHGYIKASRAWRDLFMVMDKDEPVDN